MLFDKKANYNRINLSHCMQPYYYYLVPP